MAIGYLLRNPRLVIVPHGVCAYRHRQLAIAKSLAQFGRCQHLPVVGFLRGRHYAINVIFVSIPKQGHIVYERVASPCVKEQAYVGIRKLKLAVNVVVAYETQLAIALDPCGVASVIGQRQAVANTITALLVGIVEKQRQVAAALVAQRNVR